MRARRLLRQVRNENSTSTVKREVSSRKRFSRTADFEHTKKRATSERALRARFISISKSQSPPVNPSSIAENIKNSTLPRDLAPLSSSLFKLCVVSFLSGSSKHVYLGEKISLSSRAGPLLCVSMVTARIAGRVSHDIVIDSSRFSVAKVSEKLAHGKKKRMRQRNALLILPAMPDGPWTSITSHTVGFEVIC